MKPLLPIDVLGFWIGIFLTFCILSYLYKDNPFYKFAEHLFVGVSVGAVIMQQYYNTLRPNLLDHLFSGKWDKWYYIIPLILVVCMFLKAASQKFSWLGKYPIAFVIALSAGLQINAVGQANLTEQMKTSMKDVVARKVSINDDPEGKLAGVPGLSPVVAKRIVEERAKGRKFNSLEELKSIEGLNDEQKRDIDVWRGSFTGMDAKASVKKGKVDWFGTFSNFFLLVGMCASLWYFYFSIEQKGAMGRFAKFGVWVLMIGFGASFGFTVQGRLSLAVDRVRDVLGKNKDPAMADQIAGPIVSVVSIVVIIAGIALWEILQKRKKSGGDGSDAPPPSSPDRGGDSDLPAY